MYRDLKLRGAIVQEKQVIILPKEQIISRYNGVWNLSSE
jgi:Bardet-Biedl syndrome 5 protein